MFEIWYEAELKGLAKVHQLEGRVFESDSNAVKIGFKVKENGEDVTLTGDVTAKVIKPDGTTSTISGSKSGNTAWAVIPSISVKGKIGIFLKLTNGTVVTTLGGVEAYVY